MDIENDWLLIKSIFKDGIKSSGFFAIASTNADGSPHVTPIASLLLYEPGHGVYADEYPATLSRNIAQNPRLSVLAVNSGNGFWFKSLIRGKFHKHPGLRLMGSAGKKRRGTDQEIQNWLRIVKPFRFFRGYELLWKNMKYVRDIYFDDVLPLAAGQMSQGLLSSASK